MHALRNDDPRVAEAVAYSPAPPSAVWRVLADPYSYAQWVDGTQRIRSADPSWPRPGATLHHRFGPPLLRTHDRTIVRAAEPPHRLALTAYARPFGVVAVEVHVRADGTGSRIALCEELQRGLGARFPRLGGAVQRGRMRRSVRRLARLSGLGGD